MSTLAIRVHEGRKRFGTVEALAGVSFELPRGEMLALLGPNGAGKTTTVRCLAGRVAPDSGLFELFGRQLPRTGGRDELGIVPQEIAIYDRLTPRENMQVFGQLQGLSGSNLRSRIDWALQWTGLEDRSQHPVGTFSGGMKRRVNIACSVLHSPGVIILDEPTVGVDPQSRERIYQMLDELRSRGTSILLTTHHLDEAEARCDRIVIIDHGRVAAAGTLSELIDASIGRSRRVSLTLDQRLEKLPVEIGLTVAADDPLRYAGSINDVAVELPRILSALKSAGRTVLDVQLQRPSLHAVFLALTGKDLRE